MSDWCAAFDRLGRWVSTGILERMLPPHPTAPLHVRRFSGRAGVLGRLGSDVEEGWGLRGGRLRLLADVRLDNRDELAARLLPDVEAPTLTDPDLILAAYRAWGWQCPKELIGDFAFVLWDDEEKVLVCARDALGVRPLYYALRGAVFCAAPEMRCLRRHPLVSGELDETAVVSYLMGRTGSRRRTLLRDIRTLGAGQVMRVSSHAVRIDSYWSVETFLDKPRRTGDEAVEELGGLLERSVTDRLRSPSNPPRIGVLMSGGLDSTSVATIAAGRVRFRSRRPLTAWTMVFDRFDECDERTWVRELEGRRGLDVRYFPAERYRPLQDWWAEEPVLEDPVPVWSITRRMLEAFARSGGGILLTGHGGDNLLSGSFLRYSDELGRGRWSTLGDMWRHAHRTGEGLLRLAYLSILLPRLPSGVVAALPRKLQAYRGRAQPPAWLRSDVLRNLDVQPMEDWQDHPRGHATWAMGERLRGLTDVGSVVQRLGRVAEAVGVEMRHPFLDRRLVEFVATLAPEMLVRDGLRKWILREALRGRLPESLRARPTKTRLTSYLDHGVREQDADRIRDLLRNSQLAQRGYVDEHRLREEFECYVGKKGTSLSTLLAPITLEKWLRDHTRDSRAPKPDERQPLVQAV